MRVLLVCNEPCFRGVLGEGLQAEGHSADVVLTADAAKRKLTTDRYDVVILNLVSSSDEILQVYETLKAAKPEQQIGYVRGGWSSAFSQRAPGDLMEFDQQPDKLLEQLREFAAFGHNFAGVAGPSGVRR